MHQEAHAVLCGTIPCIKQNRAQYKDDDDNKDNHENTGKQLLEQEVRKNWKYCHVYCITALSI